MRESVIYQDIRAEAIAEGRAEGKAEGRAEGKQEGEVSLVLRLLKKRIGKVAPDLQTRIQGLSIEELEDLDEALFDFTSAADLVNWLN